MTQDRYLKFVNSAFGGKLASSLGLPMPVDLERYREGAPVLNGVAVVGAAPGAQLLDAIAASFARLKVESAAHPATPDWLPVANAKGLLAGRFDVAGKQRAKALVFDATGIVDSTELDALYTFFHDTARAVASCGRVIVLGRPPEQCASPRWATAQRSLEGITRALGKELRRGAAAQLVYVAPGAEGWIDSTLAFLLSPRSAYVSGQVVRIGVPGGAATPANASQRFLAGRKVLVTGASRGIGAAIAEVMAREGATVICLDVPQAASALQAVAAELGGEAVALDISSETAPQELCAAAARVGGFDAIVHNAGITRDKTIARMTEVQWQSVININLSAQERVNDALLESGGLREGARIICVSSISGIAGNMGQTNYAVSKAGVIGMVQSMAPVLAQRGMTINAVAPGFIETHMTAQIPLGIREAGRRMNSMAQGGQPVDVAEAIAWFAHPDSAGVNGNVVRVCGQSLIGA